MSFENFKKRIKNLNPCLSKPFTLILRSSYINLFTLYYLEITFQTNESTKTTDEQTKRFHFPLFSD